VGAWSRSLGNHRAIIIVKDDAEAVRVHIPWRRRDLEPEKKAIRIVDATNDRPVTNIVPVNINREFGDIVFQPIAGAGMYHVYYMPYTHAGPNHQFTTHYAPPDDSKADPEWLARNKLTPDLLAQTWAALPECVVMIIQARQDFDRMDPMEVIATAEETRELVAKSPDQPYLLFPEDRKRPIRMTDDLPYRWIENGPGAEFSGKASPGEYYVFQIGVYPVAAPIEALELEFSGIEKLVAPDALHCINLGGTDWLGRPMKKNFSVPQQKVGVLWCGLQIPKDAAPGQYEGLLTVKPANMPPKGVKLTLDVAGNVLEDAGDGDLWRQSRLRWLDSTIGLDDDVVAPYTPLGVDGNTVSCLGRDLRFGDDGLPASIRANGQEILDKPIRLVVETAEGPVAWTGKGGKLTKQAPGVVEWQAEAGGGPLTVACAARMEFDGYVNFTLTINAREAVQLKDIRLEIPFRPESATYMMGMGCKGGNRPAQWQWAWDPSRANNAVWIGSVTAGLQCKLKGIEDAWNLYSLGQDGIPQAWSNGGKGGCRVVENADPGTPITQVISRKSPASRLASSGQVLLQAYSGERSITPGEPLVFRFGLLITPVKPLDPAHWNWRYQHQYLKVSDVGDSGANILNIHHGNELNPNINYPFNNADLLRQYVHDAHRKGVKVKIYYTVRELSNHCAELWALRSLGTEIFTDGPGGGCSWLQEHLINHYASAWHEPNLPNDDIDGAIATTGLSRWHNYYLEGLAWLLKNVEIDGLYLDGIGYDRVIMQRTRKVMQRTRPGSLIDFHSGNNFHPEYGLNSCANQYMEHFPYIDSLWFGEGFDYNESPDYWLVEISGIPFGLFGEMLQGGGNPWRGMVYGMTNRLGWGGDPRPLWKLWDAFGIQDAQMIGYWDPNCPVKTGNDKILATAYRKKDKTLVSIASWAPEATQINLDINWNALGLDPPKTNIHAPKIEGFQPETPYAPKQPIPIDPARGRLILLENKP